MGPPAPLLYAFSVRRSLLLAAMVCVACHRSAPPAPAESAGPPPASAPQEPARLSCGDPAWQPHHSETGLFSLEIPADWEAKALGERVLRLRHPGDGIEIALSAGWVEDAPRVVIQAAREEAATYTPLQDWETEVLVHGGQTITGTFDTGDTLLLMRLETRPSSYLMTTIESWVEFDDSCAAVMARILSSVRLNDVPAPSSTPDPDAEAGPEGGD